MFLREILSNSQCQSVPTRSGAKSAGLMSVQTSVQSELQPITFAQAQQVVGGCSNSKGCTSLNEGVAVVSLRQSRVTDFEDHQIGWSQPFNFSQ